MMYAMPKAAHIMLIKPPTIITRHAFEPWLKRCEITAMSYCSRLTVFNLLVFSGCQLHECVLRFNTHAKQAISQGFNNRSLLALWQC